MAIHVPDEFDLDIRVTIPPPAGMGYGDARPVVAMADTEVTCYSTCNDPECGTAETCYSTCSACETAETCYSTCSPCETVDAYTCVGDCTNDCYEPSETAYCHDTDPPGCPATDATCGGRECSTDWQTCQGATCEETGGCQTCAETCIGDTCPGSTCYQC